MKSFIYYLSFYLFLSFFSDVCYSQRADQEKSISEIGKVTNYYNLGVAYIMSAEFEKASKVIALGLEKAEEIKDEKLIAYGYFYMASCSAKDKNSLNEIEYLTKALLLFKKLDMTEETADCYVELGKYYFNNLQYQLQDSLLLGGNIVMRNHRQLKDEAEKRNSKMQSHILDISSLGAENKMKNYWLLFGATGLLSLFFLTMAYNSRNQAKIEKRLQGKFLHNLLLYQEEEKSKIASELHDSIGQQLTLIKIKSQNIHQKEIAVLTGNALDAVKSISKKLYPRLLAHFGLKESVEQLIHEYDAQTDLCFSMYVENVNAYFTESRSLNCYRLIQECLTNIIKHSKATSAIVTIKKAHMNVHMIISDNGVGFVEQNNKNGLGLFIIAERVRIMNGIFSVKSLENKGTSYDFLIPITDILN